MAMMLHTVDLAADPALGGDQLEWTDEFEWDPVAQEQERTLSGGLVISEGVKRYGRPITLASNDGAWFTLATVRELQALLEQVGAKMLLELPTGSTHWVTWNRAAGAPVAAQQLFRKVNPGDSDLYLLTLRLITVEPPAETVG